MEETEIDLRTENTLKVQGLTEEQQLLLEPFLIELLKEEYGEIEALRELQS